MGAWFKKTNRVIGVCGIDLFDAPYDRQTECILGRVVDRSQELNFVKECWAEHMPPDGSDGNLFFPERKTRKHHLFFLSLPY